MIAILAALLLWPASERALVRDDVVAALHALAEYTRCIGECDDANAADARRTFLVALQNADATLQRVITGTSSDPEPLMALLIYTRRFGLALAALVAATPDRLQLGPLCRIGSDVIGDVANAVAAGTPPQPLPALAGAHGGDGAERLLAQLEGLHRAGARLVTV